MLINTDRIEKTCPLKDIFAKIPKMKSGKSGMITFSINCMMIFWKSLTINFRFDSSWVERPIPTTKAKTRADMTSNMGGMLILK